MQPKVSLCSLERFVMVPVLLIAPLSSHSLEQCAALVFVFVFVFGDIGCKVCNGADGRS